MEFPLPPSPLIEIVKRNPMQQVCFKIHIGLTFISFNSASAKRWWRGRSRRMELLMTSKLQSMKIEAYN